MKDPSRHKEKQEKPPLAEFGGLRPDCSVPISSSAPALISEQLFRPDS